MNKTKQVAFIDKSILNSFNSLKGGKFEEKKLYDFILRAIGDLKENPFCGTRLSNKIIPKNYKKLRINNIWKYNLPNSWRLIYSISGDQVKIISTILEWFDHKNYERRFSYML